MKNSEFVDKIITKYASNEELRKLLIAHSESVAAKALKVAEEGGIDQKIDRQFVWDAAMLHDIGVTKCDAPGIHCFGSLPYLCHGVAGAEILRSEGLDESYARVCERHTGSGIAAGEIEEHSLPLPHRDFLPETLEEKLICFADKFFSKSSEPRKEKSFERIIGSMKKFGDASLDRFMQLHELFQGKQK